MKRTQILLLVAGTAVAALMAGCTTVTGGPVYEVGDCLKVAVDADGRAVKTECSDPESMKVDEVGLNGRRPRCPGGSAVTAFVEDSATHATYCGPYNR